MWLQNLKVRLKKHPKGWVVEIQKEKRYLFWTKKYWTHLISVSGMSGTPWYFTTKEIAVSEALKYFEWDLKIGTRDYK